MSKPGNERGHLEGKAALVTGASSGLGRATAIALARAGADVALVARSQQELDSAKEEISEVGRRALTLPVDLASEVEATGAVERTVEALGRIDVLVNAAGTDAPGTVEELDIEGWDRTLAVNLRAPFLLSKAAFPRMREAGGSMGQHLLCSGQEGLGERLGLLRLQVRPHRLHRSSRRLREGAWHKGDRALPGSDGDQLRGLLSRGAPGERAERGSADPSAPAGASRGPDRVACGVPARVRLDGRDRPADRRRSTIARILRLPRKR